MHISAAIKDLFRKYFLAGLAVIVPLIGTFLILRFIIVWVDDLVISMLPAAIRPEALIGWQIPGIGLFATIALVLAAGVFTRLYAGRKLVQLGDALISKIPLGRSIYAGIKQFMQAMLVQKDRNFKGVAIVEYPRRGCWILGFITGRPVGSDGTKWTSIFIPTTPIPTAGFLIAVPEQDVIAIDMGIDEAFKLIISGGFATEMPVPPSSVPK